MPAITNTNNAAAITPGYTLSSLTLLLPLLGGLVGYSIVGNSLDVVFDDVL